jgi:hypothetical protein
MTGVSDQEAREFARAYRGFMEWVNSQWHYEQPQNPVVELVNDFLGTDGLAHSVVSRQLPRFEHVNLQTALDHWMAEPAREVAVHGITVQMHSGGTSLQQLINGERFPSVTLSAPPLVDLPNGPDTTLACLQTALLLVTDTRGRYIVMVGGQMEHDHGGGIMVEVAGLPVEAAQAVHAELAELRHRLNVYRGQVLDVTAMHGQVSLSFTKVPTTTRGDVVLPETVLERVERHALGVASHRAALVQAGQHIKRGLLLFGPPGTGKTHTTRYLIAQMSGYTRLVLTGRSLHAIGSVAELARDLQPAMMVLEDVDLVAEDRSYGSGSNPVLFDLLDAMDGAAADADVLFVLTTNRADLLEPALAARPGRVDVAVEIDLPDADARRRLFDLYSAGVPVDLSEGDVQEVVERTDGVTASFLKELIRRAVLESLRDESPLRTVTARHTSRALDDLLDSAQRVTRSLLGVDSDPEDLPPGSEGPPGGWFSYGAMRGRTARFYDG